MPRRYLCNNLYAVSPLPADWETKRPFGMTTLSSEFLAQSTMPLRPFMGKLMSVITDTAGSLWMLATAAITQTKEEHSSLETNIQDFCSNSWTLLLENIFYCWDFVCLMETGEHWKTINWAWQKVRNSYEHHSKNTSSVLHRNQYTKRVIVANFVWEIYLLDYVLSGSSGFRIFLLQIRWR